MRIYLSALLALGCYLNGYSQNADLNVWYKSIIACKQIESGSYKMTYKTKYLMSQDTVFKSLDCVFKRDSLDTIFGFYFDADRIIKNNQDSYSYSNQGFVSVLNDEAKLFQNKGSMSELLSIQHNYDFFNPLSNFEDSEMSDLDIHLIRFIGDEMIGMNRTAHYQYVPLKDSSDGVQILKSEVNFWINKQDYIPIQYSVYYQVDLSGDTLDQYDEYTLVSYKLNNQAGHSFRTPDFFVEKGIHIKEYRLENTGSDEKLIVGMKVPEWNFETNKKTKLSSANNTYELVLFDFYYQSCFPCLKAIPTLNKLSKKYDLKGKGLLVAGINNIDPVDDRFYEFIKRKQISYPLVISPNNLNKEFKVLGYPTLFLMNRNGKLIYSSEGYSEQLEAELEKIIIEELQKTGVMK